jgi:UDPglucose 6-dehydrogenase
MRVSVVGAGYVGLVSGACLAELGHTVVCVDLDATKVDRINRGDPPIHEEGLTDLLARNVPDRLTATTDLETAVLGTDITLIAVGTPFDGTRIDLGAVRGAARQIGRALASKPDYHTVAVKSTVVPGTTDSVVAPLLEQESGKRAGVDFGVGMNPEFLREGVAVEDFMNPDRIVIGSMDERGADTMAELYSVFTSAAIVRTNPRTAEMIKYASNALLATLISFSNEIGNLCASVGDVDVVDVMEGVHLDRRISPLLPDGTRVTPGLTAYLAAGCGFGGSCFPKDVRALIAHGEEAGRPMPLLQAVMRINEEQPSEVVRLLRGHLTSLADSRIAVLGLAFKPGTDDIRESPAIEIVRQLLEEDADVVAYDPVAAPHARAVLGDGLKIGETLPATLTDREAVVVVTGWAEFQQLPTLLAGFRPPPLVVDARRILDRTSVPRYAGIGR